MLLDRIIHESLKIPNMSRMQSGTVRGLHYQDDTGSAQALLFDLFPGIFLACIRAETKSWPVPCSSLNPSGHRILQICCCISGRNKIRLNSRDAISIGTGEMAVAEYCPMTAYLYPLGKFDGMTLIVDLEELSPEYAYLHREFGIDFSAISQNLFSQTPYYLVPSIQQYKAAIKSLWDLAEDPSPYTVAQMRTGTIAILQILMHTPISPASRDPSFLTAGQIQIAEKVLAIVSVDLSKRFSAQELALQFGVSESSLKNYFKNVYGKSLSSYQRDARMQEASGLLKTTQLPVAEIAAQVGYASQSKFSHVFHTQFGVPPLEYRRLNSINPDH